MKAFRSGFLVLACAGSLVTSTTALAGWKIAQEVVIDDNGHFADGGLGYAHNTSDSTQYIGCYSWGDAGVCYAHDNFTGLYRGCSTTAPNLLAVIRSLHGDSELYFSWDTNGACNFIEVDNSSYTAPKS